MRVYVTKYALTTGVMVRNGEPSESAPGMFVTKNQGRGLQEYFHGSEWHQTPESALRRAEEMRRKKIASLKKSLAKLEAMKFEIPS